jgi:hypothetical protein
MPDQEVLVGREQVSPKPKSGLRVLPAPLESGGARFGGSPLLPRDLEFGADPRALVAGIVASVDG